MSANSRVTIAITLIAVILAAVAFFYYPWPTVQGAKSIEGQNLFEEYSTATVRKIEVSRVNENSQIEKIILRQRGNTWLIPAKNEYVADNNSLISAITTCLQGLKVYKVQSEDQKDHQAFGVVDPDESGGKTAGVGSKLVLSDRNGREIASLIVGNLEGDQSRRQQGEKVKYFVRRPGQPGIFLVDFEKMILTTRFSDWINPDLLSLGEPSQAPASISIDKYIVQLDSLTDGKPGNEVREQIYSTRIEPLTPDLKQWGVIRLVVPNPQDGKLIDLAKTGTPRLSNGFQTVVGSLGRVPIVDVLAKPKDLAAKFAKIGDPPLTSKDLEGFAQVGFFVDQDGQLTGANGRIVWGTQTNVLLNLVIGGVAPGKTETGLNRFVIIYAEVNRDRLPKKPAELTGSDQDDELKKLKYQTEVRNFESAERVATNIASDFNKDFSKWVYLVDERATQFLLPDLKTLFLGSTIKFPGGENADDQAAGVEDKSGGKESTKGGPGKAGEPESSAPNKSKQDKSKQDKSKQDKSKQDKSKQDKSKQDKSDDPGKTKKGFEPESG